MKDIPLLSVIEPDEGYSTFDTFIRYDYSQTIGKLNNLEAA
jgi:hypothetical protein